MAKPKRKAARPKHGGTCDEEEREPEEEPAAEEVEEPKSGSFFDTLGAGIKAAGQAAERLARNVVSSAELEKLRLDLRKAQSHLGEAVTKCWDDAPKVGVMPADPAVKEPLAQVKDLRRRIREMEQKIAELRQGR